MGDGAFCSLRSLSGASGPVDNPALDPIAARTAPERAGRSASIERFGRGLGRRKVQWRTRMRDAGYAGVVTADPGELGRPGPDAKA